ncbi:MAG: hypothetical protein GY927_05215 [bacterium]|nr:hypothetical protein [bacterium]
MKIVLIMQKLIITLLGVAFIGVSLLASVGQASAQPEWMPNPPKAIGGQCDLDPKEMRKTHMTLLDHKRDQTMRDGIRTKKYSLKKCIACHAVKDKSNKCVTVKDERHFCRSCHDYAAVRIDCFDCHASRPEDSLNKATKAAGNSHDKLAGLSSIGKTGDTTDTTLRRFIAGEVK